MWLQGTLLWAIIQAKSHGQAFSRCDQQLQLGYIQRKTKEATLKKPLNFQPLLFLNKHTVFDGFAF